VVIKFFFYFFGPHIVKVREEKSLLPLVVFLWPYYLLTIELDNILVNLYSLIPPLFITLALDTGIASSREGRDLDKVWKWKKDRCPSDFDRTNVLIDRKER
jgi:hypothetical protein